MRRARLAAGLTQDALAKAMNISEAYVCLMESGARMIRDELALIMPEPIGREVRKALADQYRQAAWKLEESE